MKSEGFWTLKAKSGFSSLDKMGSLVKSFSNLNAAVEYAELAPDLFYLLNEEDSNQALLQFLLKEYFPETNSYFQENDSTSLLGDLESDFFNEPPSDYKSKAKAFFLQKEDEELFLRGSIFKREIPRIYKNSCCITGLRIESVFNISMIDACHIVPFSLGYDDTVTNGIALCPNLHRAFDRGLITISPDYKVRLSDSFIEEGKHSLKQFADKKISLPKNQNHWPNQENLEWHMKETFKV
jgi:putative restriction endonuclease